jgi:anti-sigma-K factor RskA
MYALGSLEDPERELLRSHLLSNCETCLAEMKDALLFWYLFGTLTERMQTVPHPEPSPMLRERVMNIAQPKGIRRVFGAPINMWMRVAAAVAIAAGAATLTWGFAEAQIKKQAAIAQARIDQESAALKKMEAENIALKNLVVAARNAPAEFPGKESIVSVQDPYTLRELQRAKQTGAAMADALNAERARAADLEKRLSQTTTLLAAATRDKEDADRQYKKAFDAATLEKERGVSQYSTEIAAYKSKVHDLEAQVSHYRAIVDSQAKGVEQHTQMISMLQSQNVSMVQLRATEAGPSAYGVALIAGNSQLAFFASNLPAASAGRTYQLWLIRDKGPAIVSAGTFKSASKDSATLQFGNKELLAGVKAIAVTEEPAGGSALPTGHKLMIGTKSL